MPTGEPASPAEHERLAAAVCEWLLDRQSAIATRLTESGLPSTFSTKSRSIEVTSSGSSGTWTEESTSITDHPDFRLDDYADGRVREIAEELCPLLGKAILATPRIWAEVVSPDRVVESVLMPTLSAYLSDQGDVASVSAERAHALSTEAIATACSDELPVLIELPCSGFPLDYVGNRHGPLEVVQLTGLESARYVEEPKWRPPDRQGRPSGFPVGFDYPPTHAVRYRVSVEAANLRTGTFPNGRACQLAFLLEGRTLRGPGQWFATVVAPWARGGFIRLGDVPQPKGPVGDPPRPVTGNELAQVAARMRTLLAVDLNHERSREAIALGRLMQAASREQPADGVVDLAVASEASIMTGQKTELAFRLSAVTAWLLGATARERGDIFAEMKQLYDVRSTIVHGSGKKLRVGDLAGIVDGALPHVAGVLRWSLDNKWLDAGDTSKIVLGAYPVAHGASDT